MTTRASGTFEAELKRQAPDDQVEDATLGRMSIDNRLLICTI